MKNTLERKRSPMMKVAAVILLLGLGLSAGMAQADSSNGNGAQKVTLTRTNRDCFGVIQPPELTEPFGFAIVNKTGADNLIANVVLQNGTPNTTYNVRLIQTFQTPSAVDCTTIDGMLTTDAEGDGQTNIHEALMPGAVDAFVVLNNATNFPGDFFTTQDVFF